MGDAGAPFEQLAHSLGRFSSSLGDLAGGLAYREKHQLKDDYDIVDAGRNANPQARAVAHLVTGVDPVGDTISHHEDIRLKYDSAIDEDTQKFIADQNVNGWVKAKADPEKPNDHDVGYSMEDFNQEYAEKNAWIDQTFPDKTVKGEANRKFLGEKILAARDKKIAALAEYQSNKRNSDAQSFISNEASNTLLALKGRTPDEVVAGFQQWTAKVGKDYNAEKTDVTKQITAGLNGLKNDLQNDDNYDLATAVTPLLEGKMAVNGFSIAKHQNFATDAEAVRKLAENAIAKRQMKIESDRLYQEIREAALNGEVNPAQLGMKEEYPFEGGSKTYTLKTKDLLERLGKERDDDALFDHGIPRKEPFGKTITRVVENQQGTSIPSPYLKGVFEGGLSLGSTIGGAPDPKLENQLAAYDALRKGDPFAINKYITDGEDRKALDIIYQLQHFGVTPGVDARMSISDAARIYVENKDRVADSSASKRYNKEVNEWFDNQQGLSPADKTQFKEIFDFLNVDAKNLDKGNVEDRLNAIKAQNDVLYPKFNDQRIEVPTTEVPSVWTKKLGIFEDSKGFTEKLGLTKGGVEYQRSTKLNGYFLVDPLTGLKKTHKDGTPIFVNDGDINASFDHFNQEAETNRQKELTRLAGEAAVSKGQATRNTLTETVRGPRGIGRSTEQRPTGSFSWKPGIKSADKRAMSTEDVKRYAEELKKAAEETLQQKTRIRKARGYFW
jgi:hypothetical protein